MSTLSNRWSNIPPPKPDVVFTLDAKVKAEPDPKKINLVIGAYRDENGKPYPLKIVRKVERVLLDRNLDKEYLPIEGHKGFCEESVKLLYGEQLPRMEEIAMVQSLSGTGACRLAAEFFARTSPKKTDTHVYLSNPTWANHQNIFQFTGFKTIKDYRYFDKRTNGVDINGMLEDLRNAEQHSLIVLHLCAHNPTGADPSAAEWTQIAAVVKERNLQVLFDSAYQGYASGDIAKDGYAARFFAQQGFEFAVAQSYAKNMGLYNDRCGCFSVRCFDQKSAVLVQGLLKNIIRASYSNPPAYGARIAHLIMSDPAYRKEWEAELLTMANRIKRMREIVFNELVRLKTPGKWDHIVKQIGMFSYLGLTEAQCKALHEKKVFVMLTGRASIAGLTAESAKRLAVAIDSVVRVAPSKM